MVCILGTWASDAMKNIFQNKLGDNYYEKQQNEETWKGIDSVTDGEIRATRSELKGLLISEIKSHLKDKYSEHPHLLEHYTQVSNSLKEDVLFIGFARRFATYKTSAVVIL